MRSGSILTGVYVRRGMCRSALAKPCALVVAATVLFTGCHRGGESVPAASRVTPASVSAEILVTTTRATIRSISNTANITGALGSLNDVVVGIKSPGRLVGVYAREGDRVHKGQVLAEQDTADINSQIAQARANLRSANTRLDQSMAAYSSAVTNLKITEATTSSAADQAQAALKAAQDSLVLIRRGARTQELEQAKRAIEADQADLDSARADQTQAGADVKRYQGLHAQRAISDQQLDQAKTVKLSADARVKSASARLDSARQAYSLLKEGAQPEDVNRSQAMVDQAQQAFRTAETNRSLVEIRRSDVETARSSIDTAKAGVQTAQAQLAIAEQALKDSVIRSPIDGVVAERKAEPGTQLAVTKPDVMRIISLDTLYFDGQLSQTRFSDVTTGMPVDVVVDAVPGKVLQATVTRVFPVASTNARSFTVRVSIKNLDGRLRPQMFARGKVTLGTHRNSIVIPREAVLELQENGDKQTGSVFMVENGKAVKKSVTLGYTNVIDDEVLTGIEPGDHVIIVGQAQVQNGDAVKVSNAADAATASP